MATRCLIAKLDSVGDGTGIVIGFDGYPESVGRTLFESYQNEHKINRLLNGGDAPHLDSDVEYIKRYDPNEGARSFWSIDSVADMFNDPDLRLRYIYVHQPNGGWLYRRFDSSDWRPLRHDSTRG